MGLFDKIFKKQDKPITGGFFKTLTAYSPVFHSFGGEIYESELVRASIDTFARNVSKLKIEINGNKQIKKLEAYPNEFQTWSQFLYRTATIWSIENNAYICPIYGKFGEIEGLYTVLPSKVEIIEHKGKPWLRYRFQNGEVAAEEMSKCAILTNHQYKSDFFGENNHALYPTMDLINLDNQGIKEAVKNSATFRFMAQMDNFGSPEKIKEARQKFSTMNLKAEDETGGLLLFPNTWRDIRQIDSKPFTVDPEERRMIQENVYNYFGTNAEVVQNKAVGDAWAGYYEGKIEPFAIQLSESISRALFSPREIAQGSRLMATSNRLQYMSNTEKLQVSAQMADRGILNRDEIREIWNLPPLPNGEGQAYIMRGEYHDSSEEVNSGSDAEVTEELEE